MQLGIAYVCTTCSSPEFEVRMHSTSVSGCKTLLLAHALPLCGAANHEHQDRCGDEEEHAVDEDIQLVEILEAHKVQYLHAHTHTL